MTWFIELITFKAWRRRRARARYEFLKAEISARHFAGYRGMVIDFPGKRFGKYDFACFTSPMYFWIKNKDNKWCVFWDHARMTREIGAGGILKDNEMLIPDNPGKSKAAADPDDIDKQSPLTVTVTPNGQTEDV